MGTFKKELPCALDGDELKERSEEMASLVIKIVNKEEEKKEIVGKFTKELKQMGAEVRKLARAVNSGEELRHVECEEIPDHEENAVKTVRLDTGEIVAKRPMDDRDRQMELDGQTDAVLDGIARASAEVEDDSVIDAEIPEDDAELPGGPDDEDDPDAALPGGEAIQ